MPTDDLTPELALVLLWYWNSDRPTPDWARNHPAWPVNYLDSTECLIEAARPLIERLEREVRGE